MISQNKQLDVNVQNNEYVYAVQGEVNARFLTINFVENEIPFNLEGSHVIIRCKDSLLNMEIFNSGEIIDELNGIVTFNLSSDMSKNNGTFGITFDIVNDESESVLKVVGCKLVVLESASDVDLEGSNDFSALQQALFQTNEVLQTIQEQLITLNNSVTNANSSVELANSKILEVNSLIVSVNNIIEETQSYYKGFNPATGQYTYITNMIQSLFQIELYSSSITAKEFDNLGLTAGEFDALNMTAYDFDFKSKLILMGGSGGTTPIADINQLASDVGYIKSRINTVETEFASLQESLGSKVDKISNGTVDNFISIDTDGKIKDSGKASSSYLTKEDLLNLIYPVGTIYTNVNNINFASLLGGTWEQIKDKFLLAAGDTYIAGSTGGEATVSLTQANLPNCTFKGPFHATVQMAEGSTGYWPLTYNDQNPLAEVGIASGGSNTPVDNMPPYSTVYMWERTA